MVVTILYNPIGLLISLDKFAGKIDLGTRSPTKTDFDLGAWQHRFGTIQDSYAIFVYDFYDRPSRRQRNMRVSWQRDVTRVRVHLIIETQVDIGIFGSADDLEIGKCLANLRADLIA